MDTSGSTTIDARIDALLHELLSAPEGALTPVRRQIAELTWIVRDLVYGHDESAPAPSTIGNQIEAAIIEKIAAWIEREARDANELAMANAIRKGAWR